MKKMKQSVTSLFNLYVSRSDLAESSIALKARAIRLFVRFFGDLPVDQIKREHAEDYKLLLCRNFERSRSSANFYLANISPFFHWLACGYIDRNPFDGIRRYSPERKVRPIYTPAEIRRMLCVADPRWSVIVRLSAEDSLRRSEILNICSSDIQGDWLHVQAKTKTDKTWPWSIKNHAEALVPLSEPLRQSIDQLRAQIPPAQPHLIVKPRMHRRLMHLQAENSLTWELRNCPYSNFDRDFKRLLRRAHVQPKRFQDLRGTYATALLKGGMQLGEVSKLMRHSSVQTTHAFYIRYDKQELAARSGKILKNFYASSVP